MNLFPGTRSALRLKHQILLFLAATLLAWPVAAQQNAVYFRPAPGVAQATTDSRAAQLANSVIRATWTVKDNHLAGITVQDRLASKQLALGADSFVLILSDGRVLRSSQMRILEAPSVHPLAADANSSRLAERIPGKSIAAELADDADTIQVLWRAELRDDSNYVRQEITVTAQNQDVPIHEVRLLDAPLSDARVSGHARGSPVVAGTFFLGFEHPLSLCSVAAGRTICALERQLPLRAGRHITYSSVAGVAPEGQLRRAFLYYVERERAHPYRTFLHYNSWYDLGYFTPYNESEALDVINAFGRELHEKRGVTLSSFLFDDGWDDPSSLWKFGAGFPDGFANRSHRQLKNTALTPASGCLPGAATASPATSAWQPRKPRVMKPTTPASHSAARSISHSSAIPRSRWCGNTASTNSNLTALATPIRSLPAANSIATLTPPSPSSPICAPPNRTFTSISPRALTRRPSGCAMRIPSGAAAKTTALLESAPAASDGSPTATRNLSLRRPRGPALPSQLAHASRLDLRQARKKLGHRSQRRFHR